MSEKVVSAVKTANKKGKDSIASSPKENFSQSISPTGQILQMQQTMGNQAVQDLFKSGAIQAKLKTGQPGDKYQQEADQAADCIAQNSDCRENPLSPVEPQIQRAPANENQTPPPPPPPPATQTGTTRRATVTLPGLIVEDTAKVLATGQMKKSQFLDQVQVAVCSTVEMVLEGTEYSTASCPYIRFYLLFYRMKSSQHIERALLKYAPEAAEAKTAKDYINFIIARVAMATVIWLNTGEVTGVPKGFSTAGPGEGSEGEGTTAGVSAKARAGGLRNADNVQTIQSRLGPGQPLDGGIRSRIGSAFGQDFSHVRIHTDANAAQLSDNLNARAFTIGKDIAFAPGEYRPGTLIGDALIAHELAHTIQQQGGNSIAEPMQKDLTDQSALEEDADISAIGAVHSLWGGVKSGFIKNVKNVIPNMKSGLRLQRCKKEKKSKSLENKPDENKQSPEHIEQLKKINKALENDPKRTVYTNFKPPLNLKVRFYNQSSNKIGDIVYYPKYPPGQQTLGQTIWNKGEPYIELTKKATTNLPWSVRAVLWHEFHHYKIYVLQKHLQSQKAQSDPNQYDKEEKFIASLETGPTKEGEIEKALNDIRAYSFKFEYFYKLTDEENIKMLEYFSNHYKKKIDFENPIKNRMAGEIRTSAINRIVKYVINRNQGDRLLKLINQHKDKETLSPLIDRMNKVKSSRKSR